MLRQLKRIVPKSAVLFYHLTLARVAALFYGFPSEQMVVIGVTGTKGKSTTANLIAQLLEQNGFRVGLTSTAVMKIGEREWLNDMKMTMPGRFLLQKLLRGMVKAGCTHAVVETSSEGIAQFRHAGIHYDAVVFTNLSPEHLEAHGSYENYRAVKGRLFSHVKQLPEKVLRGKKITKRVVLNGDDKESTFFAAFNAGEAWWYSLNESNADDRSISARITYYKEDGLGLTCRGHEFRVPLLGKINAYNILAAMTAALPEVGSFETLIELVPRVKPVPGRQEFIREGQAFTVVVDYAHEPTGMAELYALLAVVPHNRLIHVLGPTGGGRDRWRRPVLGELAAYHADVVIATTDDPYDDDPDILASELLDGAQKVKEERPRVELLKIVDRRDAIRQAFTMAEPHDLVLITGKGAEQKMALADGQYIPWDDRQVAQEELRKLT